MAKEGGVRSIFFDCLLNLFFPKKCVCCGKYNHFLCFECASAIQKVRTLTCLYCGKISKSAAVCVNCKKSKNIYFSSALIAANYNSKPVKEIIHNLKYCGLTDLANMCGELVKDSLSRIEIYGDYLITYVPLHWKKERKRGYNQSKLIAQYVAKELNIPFCDLLEKTVDTKNQVGLKKVDRLTNIVGAFKILNKNLVNGKKVIIIDDVITTGSTLNECAKILKENGAKKIIVAVVAKNV